MKTAQNFSSKERWMFKIKITRLLSLGLFALVLFAGYVATATPAHAATDYMTTAGKDPCSDDDDSLYGQMQTSHTAFMAGVIYKANETYRNHKMTMYASCIINIMGYFDKIKMLLSSSVGLLASIILGILTTLLDYACESIVKGINSLLSMACLPIPSMNFSFSLPSVPTASCDGLSLNSLVQAQGGFSSNIPYSTSGTYGMSLGLDQLIQYKK